MNDVAAAPDFAPAAKHVLPPPTYRRFAVIGLSALLILHWLWLAAHLAPAIMSPDANGYVVQARLIAEQGRTSFSPTSPLQYVGMHWLETEGGTFHSRYPAGLPMLQAAAWKLHGLDAVVLVNPILASVTVLLVYFLARRLVSAPYALFAAVVVATLSTANQHALDADAHVAVTAFLVGGILALLQFVESRRWMLGLLAGGLLGAVPTIRYPEAIVGLAVGGWLIWRVRPIWRAWPAVVGAAVPLVALCVHNASAYGAFWRTGYALTNEQTGFGFGYFTSHVVPYLQGLGGQGLGVMFAFGVAGVAAMAVDRQRRSEGVLFAGITVPLVLVYMAYYFGGGGIGGVGGNLRFLIPTFPFFAVAGVWLLSRVAVHLGQAGRAAVAVVAALQLLVSVVASAEVLERARTSLGAAARVRAVVERQIPGGSILIVERTLAESLDARGAWRLMEENFIAANAGGVGGPGFGPGGGPLAGPGGRGGRGGFGGRPGGAGLAGGGEPPELDGAGDTPSPMQRGKNRAQQERYGALRPDERRERAWADVIDWAGGKPVFWLARSLDAVEAALPPGANYQSLAEVDAPVMFGPGGGGAGGPGGPGNAATKGGPMAAGRGGRGPGAPGGGGFAGGPGGRRGPFVAQGTGKLRLVRIDLPPAGSAAR